MIAQRIAVKVIAAGLLLLAPNVMQAQKKPIELKNVENFSTGHKMVYLALKDSLTIPKAGPSPLVWDYASLKVEGDTIYQELTDVPEQYKKNFPKANLVEKRSDGTMVFTEKTATESKVWGIERQGMIMPYATPYPFVKRPFLSGDSLTGHPDREYTAYGYHIKGTGNTRTYSDGWGTLILPTGKYEVMKLVFEQHYVDIADGSGDKTTTDLVTHTWFDTQHAGALLKVTDIRISSKYYNNNMRTTELLLSETK